MADITDNPVRDFQHFHMPQISLLVSLQSPYPLQKDPIITINLRALVLEVALKIWEEPMKG